MGDDDADESDYCRRGVFPCDDEERTGRHGEDVEEEEEVVEAGWD